MCLIDTNTCEVITLKNITLVDSDMCAVLKIILCPELTIKKKNKINILISQIFNIEIASFSFYSNTLLSVEYIL